MQFFGLLTGSVDSVHVMVTGLSGVQFGLLLYIVVTICLLIG